MYITCLCILFKFWLLMRFVSLGFNGCLKKRLLKNNDFAWLVLSANKSVHNRWSVDLVQARKKFGGPGLVQAHKRLGGPGHVQAHKRLGGPGLVQAHKKLGGPGLNPNCLTPMV